MSWEWTTLEQLVRQHTRNWEVTRESQDDRGRTGWTSSNETSRMLMPWASECLDVKNYKWRLNPVWHRMLHSCTNMATVGVKGWNCYQGSKIPVEWWSLQVCCGISCVTGWLLCSSGAQGLPRVADEYAESQVSGLYPAERVQDDCGATSRHQGELAAFLLKLHRWLPQLLHHRQQCRRETVRWTQPPVQTPPAGTVSFKPSSIH